MTTATPTDVATGTGMVKPAQLVLALTAVLAHAGTEKDIPVLSSVKFETVDGKEEQ